MWTGYANDTRVPVYARKFASESSRDHERIADLINAQRAKDHSVRRDVHRHSFFVQDWRFRRCERILRNAVASHNTNQEGQWNTDVTSAVIPPGVAGPIDRRKRAAIR